MFEFERAWNDISDKPKWRNDQEESPSKWNVQTVSDEDNKFKWMSKIAFTKFGLVGVDVKSHQTNSALPYPAITIGNDKQDRNCEDARLLPTPSAIKILSGGPFAYLCKDGNMVIGPINKFVMGVLRH